MPVAAKIIANLNLAPVDCHVSMLMRHAPRYPILDPSMIYTVGLTPDGVGMAEEFGKIVGLRFRPGRLMSSPVSRCVDTAQAISRGAGWQNTVIMDERLSFPYNEDPWNTLQTYLPGKTIPVEMFNVMHLLVKEVGKRVALDIFITHDTVLETVLGYLLNERFEISTLPEYLEGVLLWREGEKVKAAWRGEVRDCGETSDLIKTFEQMVK